MIQQTGLFVARLNGDIEAEITRRCVARCHAVRFAGIDFGGSDAEHLGNLAVTLAHVAARAISAGAGMGAMQRRTRGRQVGVSIATP